MATRRELIGSALAFSAWPRPATAAQQTDLPSPAAGGPDDEAFWSAVRGGFELEPESVNLVTVVRGVCTKATRERAAADAERSNAFRRRARPTAEWREDLRKRVAAFIGAPANSVATVRNTT
jgi:hypothetical protein